MRGSSESWRWSESSTGSPSTSISYSYYKESAALLVLAGPLPGSQLDSLVGLVGLHSGVAPFLSLFEKFLGDLVEGVGDVVAFESTGFEKGHVVLAGELDGLVGGDFPDLLQVFLVAYL